jgi:hypothetical protein
MVHGGAVSMNFHESPFVFIFSRFTSEALLFEALLIFSLLAVYCAFFVLRKRKFGSVEGQIPAGVVKAYLSELILDAEQLRAQLFGLLSSAGVPAHEIPHRINEIQQQSTGAVFLQAAAAGSNVGLEAKIAEQAKQIETFIAEKTRVEAELVEAKNKDATAPTGEGQAEKKLQEKIGLLEGKLAEYSVIEDDLANLKRLQQENAQLKAALGNKTRAPNVVAAPPTPATPEPGVSGNIGGNPPPNTVIDPGVAAAPVASAAKKPPEAKVAEDGLDQALSSMTEPSKATDFEGLVDQVEQSLTTTEEPAPTLSTTEAAGATIEKSDADLVAEFEKMLNS